MYPGMRVCTLRQGVCSPYPGPRGMVKCTLIKHKNKTINSLIWRVCFTPYPGTYPCAYLIPCPGGYGVWNIQEIDAHVGGRANPSLGLDPSCRLAFTRYSFTSRLLRTNQPSFDSPRPPALPTLVQYYCTILGQYTTPLPTSRLYAIHHKILVIAISCKGQAVEDKDHYASCPI